MLYPPVQLAVSTIDSKLKEWNCNKIFLATEDKNIYDIVKSTFGNMCISTVREYANLKFGQSPSLYRFDRENDYFLQGKEYLTEIVLLSMCNSFIAAICSGATAALVMSNNRFENIFAFNLGGY